MEDKYEIKNFMYLNTKILEDYISVIDGFTYDEESQEIQNVNEKTLGGSAGVKIISGNGEIATKKVDEVKRSVHISDAAKFDKVFKYLQSGDEDEQVKYYEFLTEEEFNSLHRDDFLEVLVTSRFSKMKELTDSVMKVADLAKVIQIITDEEILDKKAKEAVDGFSALGQLREGKEISCVFNFEDGKYPLVAYLDQSYFRCSEDNFVGESYLLCKIIRKVQKGQSVKLDEIFGDVKKLPLNREQRRKMPKNMDNPKEIKDVVKGPALIVIPIAVYQ
ncbi:MAG: hypothetical protein MR663_06460 [Lachnospiraceae bacterium]|uniref:DUF6414 family protein n=1 Tax=Anaerobutyricum hallii TaxID=39488 RepID=UPI002430ADBD|nr:hypothetical protein [Anaerobutyricum hallii]MCI6203529.1 hypothetical protein [Lachnospiraceae bacterium]MDD6588565.1 hypothetical protein [Anaerobutyricum hallii]